MKDKRNLLYSTAFLGLVIIGNVLRNISPEQVKWGLPCECDKGYSTGKLVIGLTKGEDCGGGDFYEYGTYLYLPEGVKPSLFDYVNLSKLDKHNKDSYDQNVIVNVRR